VNTAEQIVKNWVTDFITEWDSVAGIAVAVAPLPSDHRDEWYMGLAGNLMWAAGTFFPETAAGMLAPYLSQILGACTNEVAPSLSAKEAVLDQIHNLADTLERLFLPMVPDLTKEVESKDPKFGELGREIVFLKLFPDFNLRSRKSELSNFMLIQIKSAIVDFERQYRKWYQDTHYRGSTWSTGPEPVFHPCLQFSRGPSVSIGWIFKRIQKIIEANRKLLEQAH
jgi:hypothetical protein